MLGYSGNSVVSNGEAEWYTRRVDWISDAVGGGPETPIVSLDIVFKVRTVTCRTLIALSTRCFHIDPVFYRIHLQRLRTRIGAKSLLRALADLLGHVAVGCRSAR